MNIELPTTVITTPVKAVSYLAEATGLPRSRIKEAMTKGCVWLKPPRGSRRRLRRASQELRADDAVSMYFDERILATTPPEATLIEDAGDYSIWIKPAGLMSSGTRYGDHCAIDRQVSTRLDRPAFLVHRLDRFVWGLMLIAHGKRAAADLSSQFQDRTTTKIYRAIVHGRLSGDQVIDSSIDGRDAITKVHLLESRDDCSLVEVEILTGRKHQIRIHLSSNGHPIVGDRQYGSIDTSDIQLAATALAFRKPGSDEEVQYALPEELYPSLP